MPTTVFQLSRVDALNSADVIPAYISADGDTRGIEYGKLFTQLQDDLDNGRLITRYAAPSATGFSINAEANTHLILTPAADYATGTIVMPANPEDRDQFMCSCTRDVALLTVNGNGKTLANPPLSLNPGDSFSMKFDAVMNTWYRLASSAELSLLDIETRLNTADVLNQRSDLAGSAQSSLAAHIRRSEINLARDFNLSPGADITAALTAAMNDGRKIYIPGTPLGSGNDWLLSGELPLTRFDQIIEGDGLNYTRLRSTVANNHAFRNGALSANRIRLSRMAIETLGTGSPVYFPYAAASFGIMYWSEFNGLLLKTVDANALHLGLEFNTVVRQCLGQSTNMHSFFIQGGNTTLMETCYAIQCGADKAGYRSLSGGTFIACNGLNSGGSNFWLGGTATDTGDTNPGSAIFNAQLINCNIEEFSKFGLKLRFQGNCEMIGGKFSRGSTSSYLAAADLNGTCSLRVRGGPPITLSGTRGTDVAEGVSSAYAADFNVSNASSSIVWDEADVASPNFCTAGTNLKPAWSLESKNKAVTMGIQGASVAGANTVASAVRYKVSGDSVRVWGRLTLTTKDVAMAGAVRLTGLPFTSNASLTLCGSGTVSRADSITLSGGRTQLGVEVTASTNYIQLFQFGGGVGAAAIDSAAVVSGSIIDFDITYLL